MKKNYLMAVCLFLTVMSGCGNKEQAPQQAEPVKVKVMTVVSSVRNETVRFSGTVQEENGSSLSFPLMGRVKSVKVDLGSRVRQGQLLATLDEVSMQNTYQAAKTALKQAEDAYQRMKELHEKGSLAEMKWVEVQSKLQQAQSMEAVARKNLTDCQLYAPFSGVIAEKSLEVGQNVVPGVQVLKLVSDDRLKVRISVPETEIARVARGQKAVIEAPVLNGTKAEGVVTEKGVQANPLSRSYEVNVSISTIPITIFISLGLFYAFGIELNTVTLAALIVTLGMIVDNSIVIIDSYLEKIGEGMSRWHASIFSATHFFKSIFSATLAISITFFPFLIVIPGMIHDFLLSFPWSITLILGISLLVAMLLVPFMQFWFIRKPIPSHKKGFSFMEFLQTYYNKLLDKCFAHPYVTLLGGIASVLVGIFLMGKLPQKLMPVADRNQFAVEIYLPTGSAVEKTAWAADTMEHVFRKDPRVTSVTSFIGCSSPRFHTAYAPQLGGTNYAQLIVNTKGNKETVELLDEYAPRYTDAFPDVRVRFKQISFSQAVYPIELRLSGENLDSLKTVAGKYLSMLRQMPEIRLAQTNFSEPQTSAKVVLKEDEASRLGIQNVQLESTLAMRYGDGIKVASVWEGDYDIPVTLKSERADCAGFSDLENELIPVLGGTQVPLRQVAEVVPSVKDGQLVRRNGIYTITVMADVRRDVNVTALTSVIKEKVAAIPLPDKVTLAYGGDDEQDNENLPPIMAALAIAAFIIFFILLAHFKRISIALLIFASMTLCVFGTAVGVLIQGVDFGMTCTLGIISLMGIIVRNGIIMIDYAEELRATEKLCVRDAIYHSARRRMRPIFLTSAAASMGVIPMILGKSGLWMPMGTVICYGTLITMLFLLTVLPVAYLVIFRGSSQKRAQLEALEKA